MPKNEKKKKQSLKRIAANNLKMIGKISKHSPQLVLLMIGQGIFYGAANSVEMLFLPLVLNALERGEPFEAFIPLFALGLGAIFLRWSYGRLNYLYFRPWMVNRLHYRMHEEIFHKAMEADLACFDDPNFYNDFVWAMDESESRAVKVLETLQGFISFIISLGATLAIMMTVNIWVVLLLLLRSLLNFLLNKQWIKLGERRAEEQKPLGRKAAYVNRIFHLSDFAKELRTTGLSGNLIAEYDRAKEDELQVNLSYNKKYYLLDWLSTALSIIPNCVIFVIMTVGLFSEGGGVTVGDFAIVISQFWRIGHMFDNFGRYFNGFSENSLYIEKYRKFMDYVPTVRSGDLPVGAFESLEMKNLSFKYTEDGDYVLKNVNLSIKKGEKIALVGYNGAGKTTLIKLLLRFYDPTEGQIFLNGTDVRLYDLKEYRDRIGAVFQDFKLFSATIAENVLGRPVRSEEDRRAVLDALSRITFENKLSDLEKGIDTMLTKEFDDDGVNLSGGEAQKVAIARTFVRPYELIIMDEPSAALDPGAEYALNHSIAENLKGQTVIFISHRLSTTRMSDTIYMFDGGRLIESGAHDALLEKGGKYAEMFEVQSKNYKKKEASAS